eukprot:CAMPEP_0204362344 /NCGR_PEP_ID=MMETSP0469-20131031/39524_1 /ASSEMBLY_ACC=CAM_ASM_000384 /TAXON_ID=2969 /ORGANISM="Oxyrrhis marina" /LENGTH=79 /DNA_ID=CAMNT_0051350901 /DNA_START=1051 /DNA_END=1287 /DNA_ORIENTATION=+
MGDLLDSTRSHRTVSVEVRLHHRAPVLVPADLGNAAAQGPLLNGPQQHGALADQVRPLRAAGKSFEIVQHLLRACGSSR